MTPTVSTAIANCKKMRQINKKKGTFQNRAKVVDSLPGYTSDMAGCRYNLAPRAKLSRRRSFSTDGTMRPLERPVVGNCSLKHL